MINSWLALAAVLSGLLIASCTRQTACPGFAPVVTAGQADLQADRLLSTRQMADIGCWAQRDNVLAQYALGMAYENGVGVQADRKAALRYYRAAARAIPDEMFVYVPPVGEKMSGRVMPVNTGKGRPGLPEAKAAVHRLTAGHPH